jgi:hypothetical protein
MGIRFKKGDFLQDARYEDDLASFFIIFVIEGGSNNETYNSAYCFFHDNNRVRAG